MRRQINSKITKIYIYPNQYPKQMNFLTLFFKYILTYFQLLSLFVCMLLIIPGMIKLLTLTKFGETLISNIQIYICS